jgi:hypothetical protein
MEEAMTTITVYDSAGNVLAQEQAKSTNPRISVRAAAWQKQLDSLLSNRPAAARATIGQSNFKVANGRSQWVMGR